MSLAVKTHLIIEDRGHITIVRFIDGKILEDFEVETIGNQLYQLIENHGRRKIILDFSLVRYMSSAMLGKLAVLQRKMNSVHGNLRLCNVHPEIYPVFRITKMHTILSLHDHLDQALEGIGRLEEHVQRQKSSETTDLRLRRCVLRLAGGFTKCAEEPDPAFAAELADMLGQLKPIREKWDREIIAGTQRVTDWAPNRIRPHPSQGSELTGS